LAGGRLREDSGTLPTDATEDDEELSFEELKRTIADPDSIKIKDLGTAV